MTDILEPAQNLSPQPPERLPHPEAEPVNLPNHSGRFFLPETVALDGGLPVIPPSPAGLDVSQDMASSMTANDQSFAAWRRNHPAEPDPPSLPVIHQGPVQPPQSFTVSSVGRSNLDPQYQAHRHAPRSLRFHWDEDGNLHENRE